MKKNNLVLLATVLSVTAINSGCGQNLNGTFTGMINRTMPNNMMMGVTTMGMNNNMSVEVQSTVTLSHNGNTVTGN